MAHFAQLDDNNVVVQVIVVNNNELKSNVVVESNGNIMTYAGEDEAKGIAFCKSLYGSDTNWKQTSYNGNFRGKYAGIGDTFDGTNFVAPVVVDAPVETPVDTPVVVEAPVEVSSTDSIVAISDVGTATVTISPAETTGTVTIETSNTGV